MKKIFKFSRKRLAVFEAIVIVAALFPFARDYYIKGRMLYIQKRTESIMRQENSKLGDPIRAFGPTKDSAEKPYCNHPGKYVRDMNRVDCYTYLSGNTYMSDEAARTRVKATAKDLQQRLKDNGWVRIGDEDMTAWADRVVAHNIYEIADPNKPTEVISTLVYYHKELGSNTHCDFGYIAVADPAPLEIRATMSCYYSD